MNNQSQNKYRFDSEYRLGNLQIGENLPFCMKKGLTLIVSNRCLLYVLGKEL